MNTPAINTDLSLPVGAGGAVFRRDGVPMTTSKAIADYFGKNHKNVLRDIDRLLERDPALASSFGCEEIAVKAGKSGTRNVRGFNINSRGAALLIMGFTGDEALRWKQKFLDAFDNLAERENDNHREFLRGMRRLR